MKVSVITVSFNAENRIERTIKSVISQKDCEFEYIIVDGASTDRTIEIIKRYSHRIDKWISEPDTGIYNAMNKGVLMAHGDFCIFMNAGDMFFDEHVLSKVYPDLDSDYSIIMGNQIYLDYRGRFVRRRKYWKNVDKFSLYFDSLYHQASFINRNDLLNYPYDETLQLVSDWKCAILLLIILGKKYKGIDQDIDLFFTDGRTYQFSNIRKFENNVVREIFYNEIDRKKITGIIEKRHKWYYFPRYFQSLIRELIILMDRFKYSRKIKYKS